MALTIQNSSFANVAFADSPVTLTCKDNNGNTFVRTTIQVDASAGAVDVILPYIPSLADDLLTEVVIIVKNASNAINIKTITPAPSPSIPVPVTQKIGSLTGITLSPSPSTNSGCTVVLRAVAEGTWASYQQR